MSDVAAFVLIGGKSSRMGEDKSKLRLDGVTLLDRAIDIARSASNDVRLLGHSSCDSGVLSIPDRFSGCGPLAGIDAALSVTTCEFNFIVPVDTPFVPPLVVRHLVKLARATNATVTYPRLRAGYQPLCAVYRKAFGQVAEAALRKGEYKIDPLFAKVTTCTIDDAELRKLGYGEEIFDNLNTREDWERAQQRIGQR